MDWSLKYTILFFACAGSCTYFATTPEPLILGVTVTGLLATMSAAMVAAHRVIEALKPKEQKKEDGQTA